MEKHISYEENNIQFQKDMKWQYALNFGELKYYKDEIYYNIDVNGNKHYWKNGLRHRDDGPAVEYASGNKLWYKEDKLHRLDGPARECASSGDKIWYLDGLRHREDGLAVERCNGFKAWYKEGKLHRLDGPAEEGENKYKRFYIEGKRYGETKFNK